MTSSSQLTENRPSFRTALKQGAKAGFTLVELMVVVAIIGILAAIGVPQFQKFQAKARQSEAKTTLGGMYTAMKTFNSETGTYTACLKAAGYTPEGYFDGAGVLNTRRSMYYSSGFAAVAAASTGCTPDGSALAASCVATAWSGTSIVSGCNAATAGEIQFFGNQIVRNGAIVLPTTNALFVTASTVAVALNAAAYRPAAGVIPATSAAPAATDLDRSHFTLRSAGAIGASTYDIWFMNDAKQLANIQNGLP